MTVSFPTVRQVRRLKRSRLGITLVELMMTMAISSVTILALASIITMVTVENEKTRAQSEILTDFALSNEFLTQLLSQTTRIQACNCNDNCLMCTDSGGCPDFDSPTKWINGTPPNPPNPYISGSLPHNGRCGQDSDSPASEIETRLSLPTGALQNTCLLLVEFEDLTLHPKKPSNNFTTASVPAPQPDSPWQTEPDPTVFTGASTTTGTCNDYGQTAGSSAQMAAGCWRDLYVYYVPPVVEDLGNNKESTPGYIIFAVTTAPSRNGGVNFPGNRPLIISTIGSFPSQGTTAISASGVAGVACGYIPISKRTMASVPGSSDSYNGLVTNPDYSNTPPQYVRGLEFGFFIFAKNRYFNNPVSQGASSYESWHPTGSNFKIGKFRNLFTRVNFHNLTERGIHFLRLSSTKTAVDHNSSGHAKGFGCYENGKTPPNSERRYCCSGAVNSGGMCAPCAPSGYTADGKSSCCSEQIPALDGRCP